MAFPAWLIAAPRSRDESSENSPQHAGKRGEARRLSQSPVRSQPGGVPTTEERALVARLRDGDPSAFEQVYRAHFTGLWEFAVRYVHSSQTAEDIVHDVFGALWARRATLDATTLHIRPYLYAAVRNRALRNRQRDALDRRATHGMTQEPMTATWSSPDAAILGRDTEEAVTRVLATLPPASADLVLLRWKHGMEYPEIAHVLGISPAAAQKQGRRLLTALWPRLRRLLGE